LPQARCRSRSARGQPTVDWIAKVATHLDVEPESSAFPARPDLRTRQKRFLREV
jgi:hypothetical protein